MYYVVKMNEDFQTWDVLDNVPSEDDAYDLLEAYSSLYPHAYVDYLDETELNDYLKKVSNEQQQRKERVDQTTHQLT